MDGARDDVKCIILYISNAQFVLEYASRGGLVGYDAAFTRLGSGVHLRPPVLLQI